MDPFCNLYFVFVFVILFLSVPFSIVVTCWEKADLMALLCSMFSCFCHFPIWCPVSGAVLDCIDS